MNICLQEWYGQEMYNAGIITVLNIYRHFNPESSMNITRVTVTISYYSTTVISFMQGNIAHVISVLSVFSGE